VSPGKQEMTKGEEIRYPEEIKEADIRRQLEKQYRKSRRKAEDILRIKRINNKDKTPQA